MRSLRREIGVYFICRSGGSLIHLFDSSSSMSRCIEDEISFLQSCIADCIDDEFIEEIQKQIISILTNS